MLIGELEILEIETYIFYNIEQWTYNATKFNFSLGEG